MNTFSSALALLLASAATAHGARNMDVLSSPKVATLMAAYDANAVRARPSTKALDVLSSPKVRTLMAVFDDDEFPCGDELEALGECVGEPCSTCFMSLYEDMTMDTTCSDIEGTSFCEDLGICTMGVCDNGRDCDEEGQVLYTCAEENAEEDTDQWCPDLCDSGYPCGDELEALGECVGESCSNCVASLYEDMTEDTTCADIEGTSFCEDLGICTSGVCDDGRDCDDESQALYTCAEENADIDEWCPELCDDSANIHPMLRAIA